MQCVCELLFVYGKLVDRIEIFMGHSVHCCKPGEGEEILGGMGTEDFIQGLGQGICKMMNFYKMFSW